MTGIIIFFPSLLALLMHSRIYKINNLFTGIYVYSTYTTLTNLLSCAVITTFFSSSSLNFSSGSLYVSFYVKYIMLSILFSGLLCSSFIIIYKKNLVSFLRIPNSKNTYFNFWRSIPFFFGEIFFLLFVFLFFTNRYLIKNWSFLTTEEIILNMLAPMKGAGTEMVLKFIYTCVLPTILIMAILNIFIFARPRNKISIKVKTLKGYVVRTIFPLVFLKKSLLLFSALLLIFDFNMIDKNFNFRQAYRNFISQSSFIEENYVDPRDVEIIFPEVKRNLIYIYVESLENTYLSEELGGAQSINLIPEITQIAEKNIYFSNDNLFGGGMQVLTTVSTITSLVSQTSGMPLKFISSNKKGRNGEMLPNAYILGDILEKNGYTNEFIMGSEASYAGRDLYFQSHGNYKLLDYTVAKSTGVIPEDYRVWWGFEDQKLYSWAKEETMRLSRESAPFNLTLLTVDTHHIGGYVCDLCTDEYQDQYANVIACASRQLYDFITWTEQQDFFENTVIIIAGDHPSMDPNFFKYLNKNYDRRVLNIFINPALEPLNTINRKCSLYDMLPTTIAALGAGIQGNRLGLGVNLFSNEPTIIELFSSQTVMDELQKFSTFYAENFW